MFPDMSTDILGDCLSIHGTLNKGALSLSRISNDGEISDDESDVLTPSPDVSLKNILSDLRSNFSAEKEKLKIDEEDLFNDAITYYKDPSFDSKKRLRIMYRGQPAADTGGVSKQFFTQLLENVCETFFKGEVSKIPIYNAYVVASGMMQLIGTIIVHSILHGGPGFPVFSRSVYRYLITGNIEQAMQEITVDDCSMAVRYLINKVSFDILYVYNKVSQYKCYISFF